MEAGQQQEEEEGGICSEVNTFARRLSADSSCAPGCTVASFVFSLPRDLASLPRDLASLPRDLASLPPRVIDLEGEQAASPESEDAVLAGVPSPDCGEDSDGDLAVVRRGEEREEVVVIEHRLTTGLAQVGLQVWRGSLLLADWLLHHHGLLQGAGVLEVGAGTGLAAIVAARCGARVLATDLRDPAVLSLIQRNVVRNSHMVETDLKVAALDFEDDLSEIVDLDTVDYVLAGDVIYDDAITDSFLNFLLRLRVRLARSVRVMVAMEKRFVFTVAELETRAPAYEHLVARLEEVRDRLTVTEVPVRWQQYFCYERSEEMVMLELGLVVD